MIRQHKISMRASTATLLVKEVDFKRAKYVLKWSQCIYGPGQVLRHADVADLTREAIAIIQHEANWSFTKCENEQMLMRELLPRELYKRNQVIISKFQLCWGLMPQQPSDRRWVSFGVLEQRVGELEFDSWSYLLLLGEALDEILLDRSFLTEDITEGYE